MSGLTNYMLIALMALSVGLGSGWHVHAWKVSANELRAERKAAEDARRSAAQIDRVAEAFEERQAAADAREAELDRRTYAEVQLPAASGPCLSAAGLRILSDAVAGSNAARGLASAVPASARAH